MGANAICRVWKASPSRPTAWPVYLEQSCFSLGLWRSTTVRRSTPLNTNTPGGNPSLWPDGTPPPTPAKRLFINQPECSTAALPSASAAGSLGLRSSREMASEIQRLWWATQRWGDCAGEDVWSWKWACGWFTEMVNGTQGYNMIPSSLLILLGQIWSCYQLLTEIRWKKRVLIWVQWQIQLQIYCTQHLPCDLM